MTSLVLTSSFQGEVDTVMKLGMKSRFDDVGLAQVTPFGARGLFSNISESAQVSGVE